MAGSGSDDEELSAAASQPAAPEDNAEPPLSQQETLNSGLQLNTGAFERRPELLTLHVLYHPDPARWGERALLGPLRPGSSHDVSRTRPDFLSVSPEASASPLTDPFLSRTPFQLQITEHGVVLTAKPGLLSTPDGAALEHAVLSLDVLRRGFDVELGKRVCLRIGLSSEASGAGHQISGSSSKIADLRRSIERVADLHVPVLIRGETGTGKERVARAIHAASGRAAGPCVTFNMAITARETAASELFGHVKGAFTGAHQSRPGLFERADGGTLFLDEIGELDFDVQAMLLRTLETGLFCPLGGRTEQACDVRVLSATDADLEALIAAGSFRAALLHRLSGFEIRVPALRERSVDIPQLACEFLRVELAQAGESERLERHDPRAPLWFPMQLMRALLNYGWPGNVRELANVIRKLVVANRGEPEYLLDRAMLQTLTLGEAAPSPTAPAAAELNDERMLAALMAHDFAVGPTAAALGIPRSTLYGMMERSPLTRKASDLSAEELTRALGARTGDLRDVAARLCVSERALKLRLRQLGLTPQGND